MTLREMGSQEERGVSAERRIDAALEAWHGHSGGDDNLRTRYLVYLQQVVQLRLVPRTVTPLFSLDWRAWYQQPEGASGQGAPGVQPVGLSERQGLEGSEHK